MAEATGVEITTTRTIRVGHFIFNERRDAPGKFSFKECTVENEWTSHIDARTARRMAAALTAFADAAQDEEAES